MEDAVAPLPVRMGIAEAEASGGHVHERGVCGADRGPIEAGGRGGIGGEIFDDEIGAGKPFGESAFVNRFDALAGIRRPVREFGARIVLRAGAASGHFEADHLGAEFAQDPRDSGERAGDEINHHKAGKRAVDGLLLHFRAPLGLLLDGSCP